MNWNFISIVTIIINNLTGMTKQSDLKANPIKILWDGVDGDF